MLLAICANPAWGKWENDKNDDCSVNIRDVNDMVQVALELV